MEIEYDADREPRRGGSNQMSAVSTLKLLGACDESIDWANSLGDASPQEVWEACAEPTWMAWFLARTGRKFLIRAAVACAESVTRLSPRKDDPLATETARRWLRGEASKKEVRNAAYVAYDYADTANSASAAAAARSAARALSAVLYADASCEYVCEDAISSARFALVWEADDASLARESTPDFFRKSICDVIRGEIRWEEIEIERKTK